MDAPTATPRPRVEGLREQEILGATLDLLGETGYDKLTLDAVAARAKASKATLYRRWSSKADLVVEAMLCSADVQQELPDSGSLRDDLLSMASRKGLFDSARADAFCGLATAMSHDRQLAQALRARFVDPQNDHVRALLQRALDRGQIRPDADLDLVVTLLPAMVLFQLTYGDPGTPVAEVIVRVIDELLLPAVRPKTSPPTTRG
jgi:AcrR family transcriptional regulator